MKSTSLVKQGMYFYKKGLTKERMFDMIKSNINTSEKGEKIHDIRNLKRKV